MTTSASKRKRADRSRYQASFIAACCIYLPCVAVAAWSITHWTHEPKEDPGFAMSLSQIVGMAGDGGSGAPAAAAAAPAKVEPEKPDAEEKMQEEEPTPEPETKPEPEQEPKPEAKPEPEPEVKPEPIPEPKPEVKPEPKPEVKPEPKLEPKPEVKKPPVKKEPVKKEVKREPPKKVVKPVEQPKVEMPAPVAKTVTDAAPTNKAEGQQAASIAGAQGAAVNPGKPAGGGANLGPTMAVYGKSNDPFLAEVIARVREALVYPRRARMQHIEGNVFLEFEVSADGKLHNLLVIKGSGEPILDAAAQRAVNTAQSNWKAPGKNYRLRFPIQFQLR